MELEENAKKKSEMAYFECHERKHIIVSFLAKREGWWGGGMSGPKSNSNLIETGGGKVE